jgi:hypothetical protein
MMQVWRTRNGYIIGTVQPDELVLLGSCFIGDGAIHNGNSDFTIDCDPPQPPPPLRMSGTVISLHIKFIHCILKILLMIKFGKSRKTGICGLLF